MHLTRAELFDSVWAESRTTLAKRFGVSDVAIAKKCRAVDIPMPPPGYWAKLAAGKCSPRPVLPLRLPGRSATVSFGDSRYLREPAAEASDPQPPVFADTVESLVGAAMARIGRVVAAGDLSEPHCGLARVLAKEQARREKYRKSNWSYDAPLFDDHSSQRQMRLYSALFRAFDRLGCKGQVSEQSEWVKGSGTTYHLAGGVKIGDMYLSCRFRLETSRPKGTPSFLSLGIDSHRSSQQEMKPYWSDADGVLEKRLTEIARGFLTCAEEQLRAGAQHRYEWSLQERERKRREQEAARQAAEREHQAALARDDQRRRHALWELVMRQQRAQGIRDLVQALCARHTDRTCDPQFVAWRDFALAEADRLDPVRAPLWTM